MGDTDYASDIVPDSTTHESIRRALAPTDSMSSSELASSPSKPYSMPPSSMTTVAVAPSESARPASRWAKTVTYGRKKDIQAADQDQGDAMDTTEVPFSSSTRTSFATPANKSRSSAGPTRIPRSPSPQLGDGDDTDQDNDGEIDPEISFTSKFRSSLRNALDAIDKSFDEDDEDEGRQSNTERSTKSTDEDGDASMDTEPESKSLHSDFTKM